MKKYSLREVISDIKQGETYTGGYFTIYLNNHNELVMEHEDGFNNSDIGIVIDLDSKIFIKSQERLED